ncbi:MAG: hypothetical protein ABI947_12415 [Chloroflexota bacterium]
MYPEDRVLVGVINRKKDLQTALYEHWYRIPINRAPHSIDAEYLAFYISRGLGNLNGGIHYYARRTGYELVRRRDLLPREVDHPRANDLYYKLTFEEPQPKIPPILNPTARSVSFLYTTWDRFVTATTLADLYSKEDWFVERVVHVLKTIGITPDHRWQDEDPAQHIAELRIKCQQGIVIATTGETVDGAIALLPGESDDDVQSSVIAIQAAVAALGGPVFVDIPSEG